MLLWGSVDRKNPFDIPAVQRLSSLVRDRDLEVESLNQRIKSLLEVLQNEKDGRNIEDLEKRYGRYRTEVRIY